MVSLIRKFADSLPYVILRLSSFTFSSKVIISRSEIFHKGTDLLLRNLKRLDNLKQQFGKYFLHEEFGLLITRLVDIETLTVSPG